MKKFAADNLMFLREEYPEIYKLVRGLTYDQTQYAFDKARNGEPIVSYRAVGASTEYSLYSKYNPSHEAQRWTESIEMDVQGAKDVLFCGLGFGYHLKAFLEANPDKRVYVYEPQVDMLLCAIEAVDLRSVLSHKNIAMFGIGSELQTQIDLLEEAMAKSGKTVANVTVPAYRTAFKGVIDSYQEIVTQTSYAVIASSNTLKMFLKSWARNMVSNLSPNLKSPSFQGLRGECIGIPAIIIGSGPSLGMEIEHLRRLKGQALLISAGTSMMALQKFGIEPDLVVSMDPGEYNRKAFQAVVLKRIPFLYIPTIHSAILKREFDHLMHAFYQLDTPSAYLMGLNNSDPIFMNTGTVSGTAIQAALYMGCTDIILIGQDYSFPNDQFYAAGVEHASDAVNRKRMDQLAEWVPNVQGGQNRSNRQMGVSREGIEQMLEKFSGFRYYNASRVGAQIKYTENKTFEELTELGLFKPMGESWFIDKLRTRLKPYPEDRQAAIRNRVRRSYEKSISFRVAFRELEGHVELAQRKMQEWGAAQFQEWLLRFESIWAPVIDDEVFKNFYGFFLQIELNHMDRNWQEMREENDLSRKTFLLLEILLPVIAKWNELSPILIGNFEEVLNTPEFAVGAPVSS
ncbi:motility associated factor glycosyltransferase family protein [Cohnella fermenti]|uniref:Motility associated factor glycosyltransferase family protein n=1 Tax=Cohnella fermenti TaxID=2565925 RepID=A0A4S4C152_9BACL|nr:6-hydroxymethylpterin diphosphokinase MptE-like protein [Cohnella fermenti]THF80799.1 motility associated factor glycosyltransferase family protein [Cohnella fermenti]